MDDPTFLNSSRDGLILSVHVQPGAQTTVVSGVHGDRLKIRIAASPTDGRANRELRLFLANTLAVSKADVVIISGEKARTKRILLRQITWSDARVRLKVPA